MSRKLALVLPMLLAPLVVGCADSNDTITGQQELALTAISGAEEELLPGASDLGTPSGEAGVDVDRPPLFRDCDARAILDRIVGQYDDDGSGQVDEQPEEDAVWEARDERPDHAQRRRARAWHRLAFVYDADDSGDLDDSEMATLLDDFSVRCEAIHARLLEEFDADGSGDLDEDELAAAHAEMEARREERRAEMDEQGGAHHMGASDGMADGGGPDAGGDGGPRMGDRPDPMVATWDVDGDGELSADELATMRAEVRERIRSGEPMGGCNRDGGESPQGDAPIEA